VAATGDHGHLDPGALRAGDLTGDLLYDVWVEADPAAAEDLAGQLEQDAVVAGHEHSPSVARKRCGARAQTKGAGSEDLASLTPGPFVARLRSWGNLTHSGADLEAGEPLHGHTGLLQDRLDRLLGVGHGRLLEQDHFL